MQNHPYIGLTGTYEGRFLAAPVGTQGRIEPFTATIAAVGLADFGDGPDLYVWFLMADGTHQLAPLTMVSVDPKEAAIRLGAA